MPNYPKAFEDAIKTTLKHEGGFVNDPDDPGGATNFGVSLRFVKNELEGTKIGDIEFDLSGDGKVNADDIKNITREMAIAVYFKAFWDRRYEELSDPLGGKYFDLSVNMGKGQATKLVQRACKAVGKPVDVDGGLGPQTMAALKAANQLCVLAALRSEAAGFYRVLIAKKPVNKKFENGWLKRAYS